MAPFLYPTPVITGFKEKIDALAIQGDRLYVGTSTGSLHTYRVEEVGGEDGEAVTLVEVKRSLTRRSIEQLGYIKEINSLVVLSEAAVTLFPLPTFSPPTPLVKAKAAFSFAIHSSVQHVQPDWQPDYSAGVELAKPKPIPTVVTQLLVGCRRKVVIYSWRDGEPQEAKEAPLPHSARVISFLDHDTACFAYSPTDYAMFSIPNMTATDISTPLPVATSAGGSAMGALTGLTGYMTLGLGAKAKPACVRISETEALIAKDSEGLIVGADAKLSRQTTIQWPAPPEELVLPPGSIPAPPAESSSTGTTGSPPPSAIATTAIQVLSSISLHTTQTIPFPFTPSASTTSLAGTSGPPTNATVRLLTPSPSEKPPLFLVTTPTDRTAATTEGSTVWQVSMRPWAEQIDELVRDGQYADALALLDIIDKAVLPDKDTRRTRIRALNAVSDYRDGKFDEAIDTFLELDFNPAKVVALYPEQVAGRLAVPREGWIALYGGPAPVLRDSMSAASVSDEAGEQKDRDRESDTKSVVTEVSDTIVSPPTAESLRGRIGTGLGAIMRTAASKEERPPSIAPKPKRRVQDDLHRSVETLVRYISDRRPKLHAALAAVHITPQNQYDATAPLSETPIEELFALPNAPLAALTPEQLLRFAQILDTALYKSYLVIRPSLLGSLCRVPNWCEVSEVEEDLLARQKFAELIDLYHGKKMHAQALALLKQLGEKEDHLEDKLAPSIHYLQKLGPEHLQRIFESSRWIFATDPNMGFEIFTSEDVELPRQEVSDFLAGIDPKISARFLEYIIQERDEQTPAFHDRLAELYLNMTLSAKKRGDEPTRTEVYTKLLQFVSSNHHYSVDRLYGALSSTDLFEARAILLGRLGRHDQALELYIYRMHDYLKAEEYCKRVYQPGTETSNVFLTLLRIYLRPTVSTTADLLSPALDLISRHNPRLDAVETLNLLPPLVTAQDVRGFLIESLRAPIFDTSVIRHISKARDEQLSRSLMLLQKKRVKVTDSRM
ncbi:putative rab guanyl-nucleotide exchange factor [Lyophyllum shimeji]|uniref:Rab guanyl-nucleotide exchange factor n=1 Tax=Lyophyllum shimeji TaxID=47721 RepID=A0A9P3UUL9_LYOSH|nr:putative rab guanyl-nucleotide exchange factor [Lyophyllum shimeji]